jgi:hypothetical protein
MVLCGALSALGIALQLMFASADTGVSAVYETAAARVTAVTAMKRTFLNIGTAGLTTRWLVDTDGHDG